MAFEIRLDVLEAYLEGKGIIDNDINTFESKEDEKDKIEEHGKHLESILTDIQGSIRVELAKKDSDTPDRILKERFAGNLPQLEKAKVSEHNMGEMLRKINYFDCEAIRTALIEEDTLGKPLLSSTYKWPLLASWDSLVTHYGKTPHSVHLSESIHLLTTTVNVLLPALRRDIAYASNHMSRLQSKSDHFHQLLKSSQLYVSHASHSSGIEFDPDSPVQDQIETFQTQDLFLGIYTELKKLTSLPEALEYYRQFLDMLLMDSEQKESPQYQFALKELTQLYADDETSSSLLHSKSYRMQLVENLEQLHSFLTHRTKKSSSSSILSNSVSIAKTVTLDQLDRYVTHTNQAIELFAQPDFRTFSKLNDFPTEAKASLHRRLTYGQETLRKLKTSIQGNREKQQKVQENLAKMKVDFNFYVHRSRLLKMGLEKELVNLLRDHDSVVIFGCGLEEFL